MKTDLDLAQENQELTAEKLQHMKKIELLEQAIEGSKEELKKWIDSHKQLKEKYIRLEGESRAYQQVADCLIERIVEKL